ncbi:MAG: protein-glutamate O-methyltransferase CheR [Acidobacteriota bacterium]
MQAPAALTLEELALFNELFSNTFGLHFPEHKLEILESRLLPRLRANHVQRFMDYYLILQYDLQREIDPLTRAITNNESYFFRETAQFEALDNVRLDELCQGGRRGALRFLSAGCSSGEEAYTLNIFVRNQPAAMGARGLSIDGIDIDSQRLAMARQAVYRSSALRALNAEQTGRYFKRVDHEHFELREAFRQGVDFAPGNILELDSRIKDEPYDAIFCRNVLIYFSEPALKKAIEQFAQAVRVGGLLFLGHSESIIGLTTAFQAERLGPSIAYRRKEA